MSQSKSKLARKTVGKIVKSQHYIIMQSYMDTFCRQNFSYRLSMAWALLRRRHPFRDGKVKPVKKVKQKAEKCQHSKVEWTVDYASLYCEKGDIENCKKCKVFLAKIEKGEKG